ncbi:MAG: hypothetical protein ACR2QB_07395 [Gammaproteobacteria bacterium]
MDAAPTPTDRFSNEIRSLIRDTEACLAHAGDDREASLQREAFQERCQQALALARRLAKASPTEADQMDGDAWRARHSLTLSREFFRRRQGAVRI